MSAAAGSAASTLLAAPLRFEPVYKTLVWGGRRMERWRPEMPTGPIGESWDLADHPDGMSRVAEGAHAGRTLAELAAAAGEALVGVGYSGRGFPLMVKLIDAADRLSVQVHPDDDLARALEVGDNGKTECWRVLAEGGTIYQGTKPGIDRARFERALAEGTLADTLNLFHPRAGDFFFLEARTVHALGAGCLVYEVQQTSNVTFRVHDWDRVGLDGKPRTLHVKESLSTIDFARTGFGPQRPPFVADPHGGHSRLLAACPYFRVQERRGASLTAPASGRCAIVVCLEGAGTLATVGGSLNLAPMQTALVPASAGAWTFSGRDIAELLVAEPVIA